MEQIRYDLVDDDPLARPAPAPLSRRGTLGLPADGRGDGRHELSGCPQRAPVFHGINTDELDASLRRERLSSQTGSISAPLCTVVDPAEAGYVSVTPRNSVVDPRELPDARSPLYADVADRRGRSLAGLGVPETRRPSLADFDRRPSADVSWTQAADPHGHPSHPTHRLSRSRDLRDFSLDRGRLPDEDLSPGERARSADYALASGATYNDFADRDPDVYPDEYRENIYEDLPEDAMLDIDHHPSLAGLSDWIVSSIKDGHKRLVRRGSNIMAVVLEDVTTA
ncbi:uncharacterized protein V1510DRAFT_419391 [Dipodascopsis tothii]|uniref:uncharacterized protein n=1 Tax=Dipodascopsis tothii TaxID=44089 RepID=UPI0034CFC15E